MGVLAVDGTSHNDTHLVEGNDRLDKRIKAMVIEETQEIVLLRHLKQ
jgi:hypothetical protein